MPDNLATTLTINEVAFYWKKSRKAVEAAIKPGGKYQRLPSLVARQTKDGLWLVDMQSVCRRWGEAVRRDE